MREVPFLSAAREEFLQVVEHYDAGVPGLGEEFIAEVERAVERIATFPEYGSPHLAGTRRVVLRRFPFDIVYVTEPEGILLVVAVAHQKRSPGYWRGRVEANPSSGHTDQEFAAPSDSAVLDTKARYTPKQGQYLSFIYYYTKIHGWTQRSKSEPRNVRRLSHPRP